MAQSEATAAYSRAKRLCRLVLVLAFYAAATVSCGSGTSGGGQGVLSGISGGGSGGSGSGGAGVVGGGSGGIGSGGGGTIGPATPAVAAASEVFVSSVLPCPGFLRQTSAGSIFSFSVNSTTGSLTQRSITQTGCTQSVALALNPKATMLFSSQAQLCATAGDQTETLMVGSDGTLIPLFQAPAPTAGQSVWNLTGQFAYVAGPGGLLGYAIASHGQIQQLPGSPFTAPGLAQPVAIVRSPTRPFLYTLDKASGNIFGFTINSQNGHLTSVPGSPFGQLPATLGNIPETASLLISANGKFLLATNTDSSGIFVFSINSSTGSLMPVAGSPFGTSLTNTNSLTMADNQHFLYVGSGANGRISEFSFNADTGKLFEQAGSPFPVSTQPIEFIAADPGGSYLYVVTSSSIMVFKLIPSNGALSPAPLQTLAAPESSSGAGMWGPAFALRKAPS